MFDLVIRIRRASKPVTHEVEGENHDHDGHHREEQPGMQLHRRFSDSEMKPPYNPGPLKPFRPVLVPPPVKGKKDKRAKSSKPPKAGKKGGEAPPPAA